MPHDTPAPLVGHCEDDACWRCGDPNHYSEACPIPGDPAERRLWGRGYTHGLGVALAHLDPACRCTPDVTHGIHESMEAFS